MSAYTLSTSTYGPVPDTVLYPKSAAPAGARFCEQVNAYVPADLSYRVRGLPIQGAAQQKTTKAANFKRNVQRLFSKKTSATDSDDDD